MEQINKSEQLQHNLQELSQTSSVQILRNEISLYTGELTTECIIKNTAEIQKAFPSLPPGFFEVFSRRIKANNFSDSRLMDAVSHVIDNCVYPTPTIAQFISYDKKVKLYTYKEVGDYIDSGGVGSDFDSIKIDGKVMWVKITEKHLIQHLI